MFPLFASQRAMWFFERNTIQPDRETPYHHTVAMSISGEINIPLFKMALSELAQRHEMLRSKIVESNHQVYWHLDQQMELALSTIKINNFKTIPPIENLACTLDDLGHKDIVKKPFDLQTGPLWRCVLLEYSPTQFQLLFVFHHLIMDVTSQNIFLHDLSCIYNAFLNQTSYQLPAIPSLQAVVTENEIHTYAQHPSAIIKNNKLEYWKNRLEDLTIIQPYSDYPAKTFNFSGDRINFKITAEKITALKEIAQQHNTSTNKILIALIFIVIYNHTSETDICIGIPSANRRNFSDAVDHIIHCFMNSIPLRVKINTDLSFVDFIKMINEQLSSALENQLPIDIITQQALSTTTKKSLRIASPFNLLCNFNDIKTALSLSGAQSSPPIELNLYRTKVENFGFNFDKQPDGSYQGFLEFNTQLFKAESMQDLIQHLFTACDYIIKNTYTNISTIPIITEKEKKLYEQFNNAQKNELNNEHFIHSIFTKITEEHPEKTSIIFHGENGHIQTISYKELDAQINELAVYLINLGIGPEKTIGVCIRRSIDLIVAFLTIFKIGGTLVPLETDGSISSPASLLLNKISESHLDIILVDSRTKPIFIGKQNQLFLINIEDKNLIRRVNKELILTYHEPKLSLNHLAYIMYTSGNTGKPKGVMIEHRGLINLYESLLTERDLPENGNVLSTAPPTFDAIIFEILEWLRTKGTLHLIYDEGRLSSIILEKIIRDFNIHCVTLLPEIIKNLNPANLPSLKDVISMGAIPSAEMFNQWIELGIKIRNEWGPTETTICGSNNILALEKLHSEIGVPIKGTSISILDPHGKICPPNVPGELYVAGNNLARGYINNKELTKERFPFLIFNSNNYSFQPAMPKKRKWDQKNIPSDKSIRFYRTGDLGCYIIRENKLSINFLGRIDKTQVKINGVRIELPGVENILRHHPNIQDAHIQLHKNKDGLIAYIVLKPDITLTKKDIDDYLKTTSLIPVAWPKIIIPIDRLPINKNGKIDTDALPEPTVSNTPSIEAPKTELQKKLAKLCAEAFYCDANSIDIHTPFQELGGTSFSIALLEARVNQECMSSYGNKIISFKAKNLSIAQLEKMIIPPLANTPSSSIQSGLPVYQKNGLLFLSPPSGQKQSNHPTPTPTLILNDKR